MEKLNALQSITENGTEILCPAVGKLSLTVQPGQYLSEGTVIGRLKRLNSTMLIMLPQGISGTMQSPYEPDKIIAAQYGDKLFLLIEKNVSGMDKSASVENSVKKEINQDGFAVTAFTTGMFYARPSPDDPQFVSVGQKIEKGATLGLIEVMKTFNHIYFKGTDSSDSGTVKDVLVSDAEEVTSGQPLFIIE